MASQRGEKHASNIMGELETARRPLSAYDLLDRLRPTGVAAPLTVYRALDKLIKAGQVHRIESLNAFVACRAGDHDAHGEGAPKTHSRTVAFAICNRCGAVDEFADADLVDRLDRSLAERRFTAHSSAIEVHGLCASCAGAASPAKSITGPGQSIP